MKLSIPLILLSVLVGCNNYNSIDITNCPTQTSVDDFLWIRGLKSSITQCTCETSIVRGTYEGKTVIFIANTDPACNSIFAPTLYTCQGEFIKSFTTSAADQKELLDKLKWDSVLYRCKF